jgi:hypothetical protein
MVWDHCHKTGVFRGWICHRCNKVLGLIKDAPELLLLMHSYLVRFIAGLAAKEEKVTT